MGLSHVKAETPGQAAVPLFVCFVPASCALWLEKIPAYLTTKFTKGFHKGHKGKRMEA